MPFAGEMPQVAGDYISGLGGEGAIEELIVVGVGTGGAYGVGLDAAGDGEQGGDGGFERVAVFGELFSLSDVAVLGFEGVREADGELPFGGQGDDLRFVPARRPAGGDEDIRVEDDAHGKIGNG